MVGTIRSLCTICFAVCRERGFPFCVGGRVGGSCVGTAAVVVHIEERRTLKRILTNSSPSPSLSSATASAEYEYCKGTFCITVAVTLELAGILAIMAVSRNIVFSSAVSRSKKLQRRTICFRCYIVFSPARGLKQSIHRTCIPLVMHAKHALPNSPRCLPPTI